MSSYYNSANKRNNQASRRTGQQTRNQVFERKPKQTEKQPTKHVVSEIETYEFEKMKQSILNTGLLKDDYPALPKGETKKFDLKGKKIEFNNHVIKVFLSNVFQGDEFEDKFEVVDAAFQQVSLLFTRKFARVLDYAIPEMDDELIEMLVNTITPTDDILYTSKQSELFVCLDQEDKNYTSQTTFYCVYRSFIPLVDMSDIDFSKLTMLKIYQNLLIAEMKSKLSRDAKPSGDDWDNIDGIIQLINFYFDMTRGNSMARSLVKAVMCQRLTGIRSFLINNVSFLKEDDMDYFNDECDVFEKIDYINFIEKLKKQETFGKETALKNLCIDVINNIIDYKLQKISVITYDANYRKIMLSFITRYYRSECMNVAEDMTKKEVKPKTEKASINIFINKMKAAVPGRILNITTEQEAELLSYDQNTVMDAICERLQFHEAFGMFGFPLIEKHYIKNPAFIEKLKKMDYSAKKHEGAVALVNLYKLSVYTNNEKLFNIFLEKNKQFAEESKREVYYGLSQNYELVKSGDLLSNLNRVFKKKQPKFSAAFIDGAIRYYTDKARKDKTFNKNKVFMELIKEQYDC